MQKYNVILGVIESRSNGVSFDAIRLRYEIGMSTIYRILDKFEELGMSVEDFKKMDYEAAVEAIYPKEETLRKHGVLPDFKAVYDRIAASDGKWNILASWIDYIARIPDGYSLSQYYYHYEKYVERNFGITSVKMAVERKPGEKMYIDWAGDKPDVIKSDSGTRKVHLFVTTVGVSSMIFAEAFENECIGNFIRGVTDALDSYGCTAKEWVPDNLRQAVTKHDRDMLILNSMFRDLSDFYGVVINPPPARKPKGKATVESAVRYAETYILERLKEKSYRDIKEVNADVERFVKEMNERTVKRPMSRLQLFLEYDKPCMKSLPGHFQSNDYKFVSRIPDNYHVAYDSHYYSVPYQSHGKTAVIRASFLEVTVLDEYNRVIATHKREYRTFPLYITKDEHMPKEHLFYKEVNEHNGSFYRSWAKKFGTATSQFIDILLKKADHEEQAYRSCNGILHTAESYPYSRVEETSRICIQHGQVTYSGFMKVLKNNHGIEAKKEKDTPQIPKHENIRGPEGYK